MAAGVALWTVVVQATRTAQPRPRRWHQGENSMEEGECVEPRPAHPLACLHWLAWAKASKCGSAVSQRASRVAGPANGRPAPPTVQRRAVDERGTRQLFGSQRSLEP